jgi:hypothetical protein
LAYLERGVVEVVREDDIDQIQTATHFSLQKKLQGPVGLAFTICPARLANQLSFETNGHKQFLSLAHLIIQIPLLRLGERNAELHSVTALD